MFGAVQVRAKRHAFVRHLAQFAQAENLKAARIRKNRARPGHEFVQSAQLADQFVAGPQIQMVSIRKKDLYAEVFEVLLRLPFTVAAVPTGMKAGVSITPCGVVSRPSRAPLGSVASTSNLKPAARDFPDSKTSRRVYQANAAAEPDLEQYEHQPSGPGERRQLCRRKVSLDSWR